jgi:hypothetical protein
MKNKPISGALIDDFVLFMPKNSYSIQQIHGVLSHGKSRTNKFFVSFGEGMSVYQSIRSKAHQTKLVLMNIAHLTNSKRGQT